MLFFAVISVSFVWEALLTTRTNRRTAVRKPVGREKAKLRRRPTLSFTKERQKEREREMRKTGKKAVFGKKSSIRQSGKSENKVSRKKPSSHFILQPFNALFAATLKGRSKVHQRTVFRVRSLSAFNCFHFIIQTKRTLFPVM